MPPKRIIVFVIILSLLLSGCGGFGPQRVKIAVSLPLSLEFAKGIASATDLAIKQANNKAGNVNVEIVSLNYSNPNGEAISSALEQKNVEQALKDPSIVAYFGPVNSGLAKIDIPLLNEASIVEISPTTTWPGLTKPGYGPGEPGIYYPTGRRNFFRTVPSDELQGAAGARWAAKLGFKSVYIVHGLGSYEQGVAGVFENTARDLGITILGKDTFPIEGQIPPEKLTEIVNHVTTAKPNLVYLGAMVGSNGEFPALALRQANPTLPMMGPDGVQVDDFITALGADLSNDVYGTTVALPADKLGTAAAKAFVSSFKEATGKEPTAYDAAAYEAMNVLLYAIGHAKQPTREGVLEAMQNLGDYTGIFGTWHFDQQGDISFTGISGLQVQNGTWKFVDALK